MSTFSKPIPIDSPSSTPADFLEIQRAAVRAAAALSIETTGPLKSRIDEEFQAAFAVAQRDLDEALQAAAAAQRDRLEQLARRHAERLAEIDAETGPTLAAAKKNAEREQADAVGEHAEAKQHALLHRDEDALMVETVSEATLRGLEDEFAAAQGAAAAQRRRIDGVAQRARVVMEQHGCPAPGSAAPRDAAAGLPAANVIVGSPKDAADPDAQLAALERLPPARLGGGTVFLLIVMNLVPVGIGLLALKRGPWAMQLGIGGGVAFVAIFVAALLIGRVLLARARVRLCAAAQSGYAALSEAVAATRAAVEARLRQAEEHHRAELAKTEAARQRDINTIASEFKARTSEADSRRTGVVQAAQARLAREGDVILRRAAAARQQAADEERRRRGEIEANYAAEIARARQVHAQREGVLRPRHAAARADVEARWPEHLAALRRLIEFANRRSGAAVADWRGGFPRDWQPPEQPGGLLRIGSWRLDLSRLDPAALAQADFLRGLPDAVEIPVALELPARGSLLLQTGHADRPEAIAALRTAMLRLLTVLPAGRVRFTILDPIGLGESFAGFMHLADYADALIGGRIWTEADQFDAHLAELTGHMETVIQKYLRNEFATIDEYNAQAGELAEPYRFLVIADFPAKFEDDSLRRLRSIMESGPRCGVYTLIAHDLGLPVSDDSHLEALAEGGLHIVRTERGFARADDELRPFPLQLDAPPPDEVMTRIMQAVGGAARERLRVELPFEAIAPAEPRLWSLTSEREVSVPLGHAGAVRLQPLRLGRGLSQHVLIAGKTGSGKSNLLHVMITNLALWYGPDELELYLIDFKEGVEFKAYETHPIPHIRAIAIESDREFGISVLQRLAAELGRRGDLFRSAGVQDLAGYRALNRAPLPRTLLIVDEFQVFFAEDDRLAQEAAALLDRLVRQGRAFGIHILLGSQTLGGAAGLPRSTIGQMAVRIALQCSEADSQLILDDTNLAARLLSRAGEAIYNDAGGRIEGNSPFQVAWLPDEVRNRQLERIGALARARQVVRDEPVVFEGSAPAQINRNRLLGALLAAPRWPADGPGEEDAPRAWLGEAVAIKDPTAAQFRRQNGANLLLISQRDDAAAALLSTALLSLAAQCAPERVRFIIFDPRAADSGSSNLQALASLLPHAAEFAAFHDVPARLAELAEEVRRRIDAGAGRGPDLDSDVYLIVAGLQRYRTLRKQEESFSFSRSEDEAAGPDRHFATILREGPAHGVHVIAAADTLTTLERTFDRATLGEFDWRVLFQMSAADSSVLIDTPEANRLGLYRALLFSEEQGLMEKFRPYAALTGDTRERVRDALARRSRGTT